MDAETQADAPFGDWLVGKLRERDMSLSDVARLAQCDYFYSCRRRHMRFKCDWSSDVCSSDLTNAVTTMTAIAMSSAVSGCMAPVRSEERRVGKECRARRENGARRRHCAAARRRRRQPAQTSSHCRAPPHWGTTIGH